MSSKDSGSLYKDWLDAQRQYLDIWTAFGEGLTNRITGNQKKKNPMTDPVDQWWKIIAPALPEGGHDLVKKLAEQSRLYFFMGEQFINLLNNIKEFKKLSDDWQSVLNTQFDEIKKLFVSSVSSNDAMHELYGAWQLLPFDTLQRTLSSSSVMPGDFLEDLKPENIERVTDRFLSIPGVGYTRESQEQIQNGIKLWNEYVKSSNEFNNAMCNVSINALDAMRMKIIEMSKNGEDINNLRAIYDLWVDCNEEAYAEFVFSNEYSELNGKLTNALMAVKQHGRNIVDEGLGAMNMPTRKGINTMQKRQQEMRREQKIAEKKIDDLQDEIVSLREQLKHKSSTTLKNTTTVTRTKKARKVKRRSAANKTSPKQARKEKTGNKIAAKKEARTRRENRASDEMIIIKI